MKRYRDLDRNDYKNLINEAQALIKSGGEADALDLLDSVNWRKIRNVNALIEISNLYEKLGHIEDSKTLLEFAHDRSPIGRMILYHLTLVCVKMGEIEEAEKYVEEFVQIAPHDSKKYILRYNIAKAKNADIKELILILEEMKNSDFIEEWAFELAYLYHRAGDADSCIALCDEIIIWFGDGPYVAKALELKMLYSPLEDEQAEKYKELQNQKRGITHFKANEMLESGEVLHHDIDIATVEESPEHFNTVNLQAEIKRNIEEIMEATKEGEVEDNLENIKGLIEDIPYLQVQETLDEVATKQKQEGKEIDASIKNKFQELLEEEYDGQISLFVPEEHEKEQQIEGQITIQDVMDNWAKTQRAAEEALEKAEDLKLQQAKENAIEEANQIMDKLEDAMPKLNAGVKPSELMKEEVMTQAEEVEAKEEAEAKAKEEAEAKAKAEAEAKAKEEAEAKAKAEAREKERARIKAETEAKLKELAELKKKAEAKVVEDAKEAVEDVKESVENEEKKYTVPKFTADGEEQEEGVELPVVEIEKEHVIGQEKPEEETVVATKSGMSSWKPPVLSEEEIKSSTILRNKDESRQTKLEEASKIVEDINKSLQNEIDKEIRNQEASKEEPELTPITDEEELEEAEVEISPEVVKPEVQRMPANWEKSKTRVLPKIEEPEEESEDIDDLDDIYDLDDSDEDESIDDTQRLAVAALGESLDDDLFKPQTDVEEDDEELPVIAPVDDSDEDDDLDDETMVHLTKEEKDIFSYFMPIEGMERTLCKALTNTKVYLQGKREKGGHIIVQGIPGSGKTMLATSIVKVLQSQINLPAGNVGKVDGDKLNGKDIATLFSKIQGGCLIIEKAGEMNRETLIRLLLMIENDKSGVLIILEDSRIGIERIMNTSAELSKEFTEKIVIPPFTIDELVEFAKKYADDCECVIEEMGILALYDRINIIQSLDHPTAIAEVKEIMDEAMENADKGGMKKMFERFGNKKYDENGYMILREKDFQN